MYKLKKSENAFQVTKEGPFEYHIFKHGKIYTSIPEEEKDRFEEIGSESNGGEA